MFVIIRNFLLILLIIFPLKSINANEYQLNYAINMCKQDTQQFRASGLPIGGYLKFCECYMTNMINSLDEKEQGYQKKYKKPSGKFIKYFFESL
jgi:hypothetical protein